MATSIGGFLGGLVVGFLLIGATRWLFGRLGVTGALVVAVLPPLIFLALATVLGGYGFAKVDEPPAFADAFLTYLIPAVLVGLAFVLVDRGRRNAA